ncbi:helix-turn-helix transcriptional regulator [Streptomyces pseudogriseolus]|uniref:HTH luxR-type domain-containing protein n=1 Tax=Streptomyces pseudogriseolus TaxID=36817 RepID=A0ABQ2TE41_STREZ|nr:AAA family ATPase [Streptomyces rubiginosus]GGS62604.1 hypothetical protein GCM10010285_47430 [Streptomyces rubiginosus]
MTRSPGSSGEHHPTGAARSSADAVPADPAGPGDAAGAADPVEREYELSVVSDLVRRTAAGHPGLLLVEGQEGIGKTTLLRSLAELARAQGLRVLEARGERTGRQTPFAVAHALLHPYLTDLEEGPALCDGPVAEAPGTAIAAGRAPYPVGHNNVVGWPEGTYDVLAGLHRTVRRISRPGPVLLVVDDAEQADAASLRFLAHTARRLSGMPVLLAVSRCPETDAPLLDEMATRPLSSVLRLRPLTERGIGLIARRLTGRSGDQEFLAACLSATNGIPLLVTRLLAALHREGSPLTAAGIARAHLEDVALFGRRVVATLHQQPVALRAAQAMAVLGDGAPFAHCAALALLDPAVFTRAVLTLDALGLVSSPPGTEDWYFAHPPTRETVLADMSPQLLMSTHLRAARLLHDGGAPAEQVAEHLRASGTTTTEPWARTVLREAARTASRRGAHEHAVELLRHCVPEDADSVDDPALMVELGLSEVRSDPEAGIGRLLRALPLLTAPDRRLTVLTALIGAMVRTGQVPRAVELLRIRRAEAVAAGEGPAGAHVLEAHLLLTSNTSHRAFRQVLDAASFGLDPAPDTAGGRALLAARAVISVSRLDGVAESLAAARAVLLHGTPPADAPATLGSAAAVLLYTDRPDEAETALRRLLEGADVLDDWQHATLLALCADAYERQGALDRALAATADALRGAPAEQTDSCRALARAVRLQTLLDRDQVAEAAALAPCGPVPPLEDGWQWNELLAARGRLRLAEGDAPAALVDLTEAGERQRAWQRLSPAVSSWWYWAGRAYAVLGNMKACGELAEEAVDGARRAQLPCALGAGLELLAAARGEDGALPLLEEAEAVLTATPARLALTRVRIARGRALYVSGRTEAARTVLREALETAYALEAHQLYATARRALVATGARPRRPVSRGPAALTPGELQVARLAAAGDSNVDISRTLFVTQRTVETHLTSAYRKLGISGRRGLRAALAADDPTIRAPGDGEPVER